MKIILNKKIQQRKKKRIKKKRKKRKTKRKNKDKKKLTLRDCQHTTANNFGHA